MKFSLLALLAAVSATTFAYDGNIEGYRVTFDVEITKHIVNLNMTFDVLDMECSFERTFTRFPCYKWIEFDLKTEHCMHEISKHISALQVRFNNDMLDVSAKKYLWITEHAPAEKPGKDEICRP